MAAGFSRGDRLILVLVFAIAGVVVAAYLTAQWYQAEHATWCDVSSFFNCTRVRESSYAAVAGIPTAMIGVGGFGLLAAFSGLAFRGHTRLGPWALEKWILVFAGIGAAIGLGLSVLEVFVIQAVCILCVLGFGLDLAILGTVASVRELDT